MKKRIAMLILAVICLTGCSKKEEDFVLKPAENYEWSNMEETVPLILRDDGLETETESETETETETRKSLSDIQLGRGGSLDMYEELESEMFSMEQSEIVLESTPIVVDQASCAHNYEQTGTTKEPTCIRDGSTSYKCTICGKVKTESIPATGHDYIDEIVAPTCTAQGYTLQKCSKCGSSSKSNFTALTRHKEEHITIQEPQCIVEGIDEIRCPDCNQLLRYENVKVLGHDWEVVKEDKPCVAGAVIAYKCKRCGLDRTEKLKGAHVFEAWKVETAATCKAAGKQTRTCSVCSYKEEQTIAKLEHDLADWKIDKKATCSSEGERSRTCKICNERVEIEEIPRVAHVSNGDWEVTKAATCTSVGIEKATCAVCGQIAETRILEKLNHFYTRVVKVEPTCTTEGVEVQRCSKCSGEIDEKIIPALGHNYMLSDTTEPKCEVAGTKVFKCARCNDSYTEEIPALGHTYNSSGECIRCGAVRPGV